MRKTAFIRDPLFHRHNDKVLWHPESKARLDAIERSIDRHPWEGGLLELEARDATRNDILRNHSAHYFERIEATRGKDATQLDPDTSASAATFEAAMRAAGAGITLADAIMAGQVDNGFTAVRPPGHHAVATRSMGFCIFNNVAILAQYLRGRYQLDRIAIVDFDVHHGNGTQDSFFDDPHVLYISSHRYPFFPGTGDFKETGLGEGMGYTMNIPLPPSMGDADFIHLYQRFVFPALEQYNPQFIIVSAGYDAHQDDPLGGMRMTQQGYGLLMHHLMDLAGHSACQGKVAVTLEGGYDVTALAHSVQETIKVLRGEFDWQEAEKTIARRSRLPACDAVEDQVYKYQRNHWKNL